MILYSSNAYDFRQAVDQNKIVDQIERSFIDRFGQRPNPGERKAWTNSLRFMETIVRNSKVPDDCGVLIEFNIPATSKRVDFIITGHDTKKKDNFIIIELKQWDTAESTDKEDVVKAFVGNRTREMPHPSYQASSYMNMIEDMNEAVRTNKIICHACSYLHNYREGSPEPLLEVQYQECLNQAPVFFKDDHQKLEDFLAKYVGKGKGMEILYHIENGKIKPSKKLIDHVDSIFRGNSEFILLDEQKVAFSTIINLASRGMKTTVIVKGGPGTGKSVVSLNAFSRLLHDGLNVRFVAPNASFRTVLVDRLAASSPRGKGRLKSLFSGSSQLYNVEPNLFDVLIVDEAHRLKDATAYQYKGYNQVEDVIRASKTNVFFIDDAQRIRPEDIGSVEEIRRVAARYQSEVYELELKAQFRCSGAEGFINWLDTVLQIRETANYDGWDQGAFEFKVCKDPHEVYRLISEKNQEGYKARMLAGYAWKWTGEEDGNRNGEVDDVIIPEHNFSMPWNARSFSTSWANIDAGINQIGCVHTSQGLEFDYVGVIIGNDLQYDSFSKVLVANFDEYMDSAGKKGLKNKPHELTALVSNIYKVLMSRGMKGCYIFCRDEALQLHFGRRMPVEKVQE